MQFTMVPTACWGYETDTLRRSMVAAGGLEQKRLRLVAIQRSRSRQFCIIQHK